MASSKIITKKIPVNAVSAGNEFAIVSNPKMIPDVLNQMPVIALDVQAKSAVYPNGFNGIYSAGTHVLVVFQSPAAHWLLFINASMKPDEIAQFFVQNQLAHLLTDAFLKELSKAADFCKKNPGDYRLQFDYRLS